MIARRGFLTGAAALLAVAPANAMALPPDIRFNVMRNGSEIGRHVVTFRQEGASLLALTDVHIAVRLGPIVLFRYTHSVRETWHGGQFLNMESETDDDGKHFQVRAAWSSDQIAVETLDAPRAILPPSTIPLTHWNILCTERPLFNPQDGVPVNSTVVARGEEMVPLADGKLVRAAHYSLVGKVALDDWYDDSRQWTALRSIGKDGSTIDYRRVV